MLLVIVASDEDGTVQGPVGCVRVEGTVPDWGQSKQFDAKRLDMDDEDAAELVEMIKSGEATVAKSVRYVHAEASAVEALGFAGAKKKKKASKAASKAPAKSIKKADAKKGAAKSGKGKAKDEKDKVKRALTGYQLFASKKRAECVEELKAEATPEEPFRQQQTMKRLAEKWNALSEEEKLAYKTEAAQKAAAEAESALFGAVPEEQQEKPKEEEEEKEEE